MEMELKEKGEFRHRYEYYTYLWDKLTELPENWDQETRELRKEITVFQERLVMENLGFAGMSKSYARKEIKARLEYHYKSYKIFLLQEHNQQMGTLNAILKEIYTALTFAPDGKEFEQAKEHFASLTNI